MNHQTFCPECGFPLPSDSSEGLCPQCTWNRRIVGSPRRLGRLLLLLGGGWSLLWMAVTAWCIIQANLQSGAGRTESAGYAVMGIMMTVIGLVPTVMGIRLARTSRTLGMANKGKRYNTEAGAGRSLNPLAAASLGLGVLGFMFAPILGPASVLCGALALRAPGIDSRNRAFAWAGIGLGAVWTAILLVQLLGNAL